jgi:hypothetical protein
MNFTRETLYELVWSKPLGSIAKEYDTTEYLIRKTCKKYEVPLPLLGYWKKLQYGKTPAKEKLKVSEKWEGIQIRFLGRGKEVVTNHSLTRLEELTKEIEKQHPDLIKIPDSLSDPDPMILPIKATLESQKPTSSTGKVSNISCQSQLVISVAKETVPRALRFMNAFIKLSKARGHQWELTPLDNRITVNGETYYVNFQEKSNWGEHEVFGSKSSILIPNGILSLKLSRKEYKDGKIPLEQQLPKIMADIELRAEDDKINRAKNHEYNEECRRIAAINETEIAKEEWDENKIDVLKQFADQWNLSQKVKGLIDAVKFSPQEKTNKVIEWIKWARKQEKILDPLSGSLDDFVTKFDFNG